MAAINVTNDALTWNQLNAGRVLVRTSAGIPYVVARDVDNTAIDVFKGDGTTPTSFTAQDTSNNPSAGVYGDASAAIDSSDIIHIVYMEDDGKTSACRYVTFATSTDTYSGDVDVDADIGDDPTAITNLYSAIAIDANDIPHIAYTRYDADMGSNFQALYYNNRIGGAWNASGTAIVAATANLDCHFPDIAVDADNIPVVSYDAENGSVSDGYAAQGNANDASSFTLQNVYGSPTTATVFATQITVDSSGNHYVFFGGVVITATTADIFTHTYGAAWTSWSSTSLTTTGFTPSSTNAGAGLVADGTDIYIFAEDATSADIKYEKYTGSWSGTWTTLETGTFNTAKAKWAFWVDNDSGGALVSSATYYFDGSDAAASDPDGVWTNETNSDDGDVDTDATTSTSGTESTNYIEIQGTNAPASGDTISFVTFSHHNGTAFVAETTLTEPSGGWTWAKVQGLETRFWKDGGSAEFRIYEDGNAGGTNIGSDRTTDTLLEVSMVRVTVHTRNAASELDYTFADEVTGEEDIFWNSLSLAAPPATPDIPFTNPNLKALLQMGVGT